MATPTPLSLQGLPSELRMQIYRFLLGAEYNEKPLANSFVDNGISELMTPPKEADETAEIIPKHKQVLGPNGLKEPGSLQHRKTTGGPPSALSFSTSIFRTNRFLGNEARVFFHEHNRFARVTYQTLDTFRAVSQYVPHQIIPADSPPMLDFILDVTLVNQRENSHRNIRESVAVPAAHLLDFCAAKLAAYAKRAWHVRPSEATLPLRLELAGAGGMCARLEKLEPVRADAVTQLMQLARHSGVKKQAGRRVITFKRGPSRGLAALLAAVGHRFRLHVDDLLHRGYPGEARLLYSHLVTGLASPRPLQKKVPAPGAAPGGGTDDVVAFFKHDVLDCFINAQAVHYLQTHGDPRDPRQGPGTLLRDRARLLHCVGWLSAAEMAQLTVKVRAVWACTLAQLVCKRSLVGFVPFQWRTMSPPEEGRSAEAWSGAERAGGSWFNKHAEQLDVITQLSET